MSDRRNLIYLTNYVGPHIARQRGITSHSDAANRRVEDLLRALRAAGYTVHLVSAGWKRSTASFRYHRAATEDLPLGIICHCVPYLDFPFLNALVCIFATLRLVLSLRRRHPDATVLFYNPTIQSALPALLAHCFRRVPIFIELEDGTHLIRSVGWMRNSAFRLLLAWTRPLVGGAIVPSQQLAAYYAHTPTFLFRGCPRTDVAPPTPTPPRTDVLIFLFAGTLDGIRGVDILFAALKILDTDPVDGPRHPVFLITGTGPRRDWVYRQCSDLRNVDARYLGRLPLPDFENTLAESHVGLALQKHQHPFSQACFPSKVISLIAAGKIVITSNVSDIAEFAGDHILLYDRDDPQLLADKIRQVCRDPDSHLARAYRARQWFNEQYSLDRAADALRRLIG